MKNDLKDHLIKALKSQPDFSQAHLQLAMIYQDEGDCKNATKHYKSAISADEIEIDNLEKYGEKLMQTSQFQNAKNQFLKSSQKKNHCSIVYYKLALHFRSMGKDKSAQKALEDCIKKNPKLAKAHRDLAIILFNNKKLDDARFHLEKSIEIDYSDSKAHLFLGKIMVKMNDLNDAEQEYLSAMDINMKYIECMIEMALLKIKMGNNEEAKKFYSQAQELDSNIYHNELEAL